MRWLLAPLRAVMFSAHVLIGIAIVIAIFPFVDLVRRNRINQGWTRILIALTGARVVTTGISLSDAVRVDGVDTTAPGRLALANHVSWLDVFAINAVLPCRFVAKAEISKWPLLGILVARSGTLFIERGRRHAVAAINHAVSQHLRQGETIVVFAEGTTTDGSELLPFHSNLIAPAIEVGAAIWPIAVRYTEGGQRSTSAAFIGEMRILTSLAQILIARRLVVEVAVLPRILPSDALDRHAMARAARAAIAQQLGL